MVQKKRKQGSGNQAASKRQKQDGQKALSKDINIPVDEGFKENGELVFSNSKPIPAPSPTILVTTFNNAHGQGPLTCHMPSPIKKLNCVLGRLD
jgi:hypothetical protein